MDPISAARDLISWEERFFSGWTIEHTASLALIWVIVLVLWANQWWRKRNG